MTTLLIGMALAFILGATTAIVPLWLSNPDLFKRTQPQAYPVTSKPVNDKPKEKTPEELKKEEYLKQIGNMLDYDGKPQVDAE